MVGSSKEHGGEGLLLLSYNIRMKSSTILDKDTTIHLPSYAVADKRMNLLVLNELNDFQGEFVQISIEDDSFLIMDRLSTYGTNPCHISYERSIDTAVVCNYDSEDVLFISGVSSNKNKDISLVKFNIGSKPHYSKFIEGMVFIIDSNNDEVVVISGISFGNYSVVARYKFEKGSRPRHFSYLKKLDTFYFCFENSRSIIVLRFSFTVFKFTVIQDLEINDTGSNKMNMSKIELTRGLEMLVITERLYSSIYLFDVNQTSGLLSKLDQIKLDSDCEPRDFYIARNNIIFVCCLFSNSILLIKINKKVFYIIDRIQVKAPYFVKEIENSRRLQKYEV